MTGISKGLGTAESVRSDADKEITFFEPNISKYCKVLAVNPLTGVVQI